MIKRSFDRMLPKVNFDAIANQANDARERIEAAKASAPPVYTPPTPPQVWELPPEALAAATPWAPAPQAPAIVGHVAPVLDSVFPPNVSPFPIPPALAVPVNDPGPFAWPQGPSWRDCEARL
jgi:hypothetical protein